MALKDIMVHIDNGRQVRTRAEYAVNLAAAHDAHLTGLYVLSHAHIPGYIRAQISADVIEQQLKAAEDAAKKSEAMFRELADRAGITYEWRCVSGDPLELISLNARYADVAIIGQRDKENGDVTIDTDMPDRLILSVGRPVLVVPYVGHFETVGERVMVAWDSSRLATRAVNDAIPFMKKAKSVAVLAVNPEGGAEGHGDVPGADICLHLARHGIKAEAQHIHADDVDVADMLLSRAADEGIDLFVMGSYGHARWRELVLGGVTRYMLEHMTLPVLMSH
ncbi:MAG: universal stress protein [Rhodobacterales bacterium]|nr:universal stress protein [Rhodobacterales bacterium]